jgi:hypothetical protein
VFPAVGYGRWPDKDEHPRYITLAEVGEPVGEAA